jgi:hypothetical protein
MVKVALKKYAKTYQTVHENRLFRPNDTFFLANRFFDCIFANIFSNNIFNCKVMRKKVMRKLKKLNINSLVKEFELLDEKHNAGTLGGSYYYDVNGAFLGNVGSDSYVRFVTQQEWEIADCYKINGQGVLFTDAPSNMQEALICSLLPASAQGYVDVQYGSSSDLNGAVAAFLISGSSITFSFDNHSTFFNDYNNLQSVMNHESYHWNNGHVSGSADEVATIMAQINDSSYQGTTNEFRTRTADYLYQEWGNLRDTPGHTLNDAYRIAGVDGYSDNSGYSGYSY